MTSRKLSCVRGEFTPRSDGSILADWLRHQSLADAVADFLRYTFGMELDGELTDVEPFFLSESSVIWNDDGRLLATLSFRPAAAQESRCPVARLVSATGVVRELTIERYAMLRRGVSVLLRRLAA